MAGTAQPWWLVSTSTFDGKPWNVITFEGPAAAARGEGINVGGFPKGPFATLADLESFAKANGIPYINDPGASSGNPITQTGSAGAAGAKAAGHAIAGAIPTAFRLTFGNTGGLLGRIIKVTLGAVLLIGGILKMAGVSPAKIAGAVPAGIFAL